MRILLYGLVLASLAAASCVSTGKLKDGETAYRLGKYSVAVDMLREEFEGNRNPVTRSKLAYRIGQSYDALNQARQSGDWFAKAYEEGYGPEALYAQAQQLKKQEDYEAAMSALKEFLKEEPDRRPEVNREIAACRRAIEWKNGEHYYTITNLEALNSPAEDFSPVFFENGALVFTSGRTSAVGEISEWTGGKYYDLFTAVPEGGDFSSPEPFDIILNQDYFEGAATFSADFAEMVYTQCGSPDKRMDDACQLLYRYREPDGSWSEAEQLNFFGDSVNIGHPAFSPDAQRLYFSAAGDPEGYGGADLYYVKQTDEGWGSPINLGPTINTERNEVFPYVHRDETLYFSSDGHPGLGGLDIWTTTEIRKKWQRPENMGYPVNSGADDFGVVIVNRKKPSEDTLLMGYMSSSRPGGRGSDDLYRFILKKAPPPPPLYVLKGDVVEPVFENPDDISSAVIDYKPLPQASMELFDESAGTSQGALEVGEDARYETVIGFATEYRVAGSLEGYFTRSATASTVDFPDTPGDTFMVEVRVVLDPIPDITEVLTLENIYYDFNDTTIRDESLPALLKLTTLLVENPTLQVEIGSHTDSRGTFDYNDNLSRGRANSVVAFLVGKGIPRTRLEPKGYGERVLVNECADNVECSEDDHQINRRTTFKVLGEIEIKSERPEDIRVDPKR